MRYLTVIRHAKAVPAAPGQADEDRPLAPRGRRQCAWLRERALDPEGLGAYGPARVLVSAARRTRETYGAALEFTPFVAQAVVERAIYNGRREVSAADLLDVLRAIDDETTSLAVVGHNPTVFEFVIAVATHPPAALRDDRYPLAGAIVLAVPGPGPVTGGPYDVVAVFAPPA